MDERKRWLLVNNPLSKHDDDPVQLVACQDGQAVGRLDLVCGAIASRDASDELPVLWTSSLWVDPNARNSLFGVSLILRMQKLSPAVMACGVSQQALPVYDRLKWADFSLKRWMRVRRSRAVVERYVPQRSLRRFIEAPTDLVLALHGRAVAIAARFLTRGLTIEHVERAEEGWDWCFANSLKEHLFSPHRSAAWLNWLISGPDSGTAKDARRLYATRDNHGRLLGYVLLRVRHFATASARGFKDVVIGTVSDWGCFSSAVSELSLVVLGVSLLEQLGPDAVEVCADSVALGSALKRLGFVGVGSLHVLLKADARTPLGDELARRPASWRLRAVEGDNFF